MCSLGVPRGCNRERSVLRADRGCPARPPVHSTCAQRKLAGKPKPKPRGVWWWTVGPQVGGRWLLPIWYEGAPPMGAASVLVSGDGGTSWAPRVPGTPNTRRRGLV